MALRQGELTRLLLLLLLLLPTLTTAAFNNKPTTTTKILSEKRANKQLKRSYLKACRACLKCRFAQPAETQNVCDTDCEYCSTGTTQRGLLVGSGGGGDPLDPYAINFQSGVSTISCYDIPATQPYGKCGSSLYFANDPANPGIDFDAAFPLGYWPPSANGNCPGCNLTCSSYWSNTSFVHYQNAPLCYSITSQTTNSTKIIRINDACGGNAPDPPGILVVQGATATSWPVCGPIGLITEGKSASFDAAQWAQAYGQGTLAENIAYTNVNQYRCPSAQECRRTWYGETFPDRTDPPCPPGDDYWVDFCSGKYMHFDLITQRAGDVTCTQDGGLIYDFCGASGHCVVDYTQIPCPNQVES